MRFFTFARHLDQMSSVRYAERDLRRMSQGEAFPGLFANRLGTRRNAVYLSFSHGDVRETSCRATEHYRLTSAFLAAPEQYLHHLLGEDEDPVSQ